MAETPLKRQREEETETAAFEETKRHKSYNDILSFLDSEEDEPNEDLSSLITTLQQEITPEVVVFEESSKTENDQNAPGNHHGSASSSSSSSYSSESSCSKEDDKERVIRHLLEASDDELGIPNMEVGSSNTTSTVSSSIDDYGEVGFDGGDNVNGNGNIDFALCDGLWALEDEAANYYTLLQSELFM